MNKRGISPIVATVLMILLVIVGISAVFVSVREVSQQTSSVPVVQQCLTLNTRAESCVIDITEEDKSVRVKVVRGTGEGELSMIKILFDTPEGLKVREENVSLSPLGAKVFTYTGNDAQELLEAEAVDLLGVIDGNLCRATGSPVKCVAGEIEDPGVGNPPVNLNWSYCSNYSIENICDHRIARQNGYSDYPSAQSAPSLNELYSVYGVNYSSLTLSGTSLSAGKNVASYDEYFNTTKEDVLKSLDNFARLNNVNKDTTDLLLAHIENPIPQGRLDDLLSEQGMKNFSLYVNATKMRLAAVKEYFPNAKVAITATIRPPTKGDLTSNFEESMKGYLTASALGMYDDLDYLTPIIYITASDQNLNYLFVGNMTLTGVEHTRRLNKTNGEQIPIAPLLSIDVINFYSPPEIPPEVAKLQHKILQEYLRPGEKILYWFGSDRDGYLKGYLENVKPVPCSCAPV